MRYNSLLAQQYSVAVAALFNLQEQPSLGTVSPELVINADLFGRPEFWALYQGAPWGASGEAVAVTDQFSVAILQNPVGSGELVTVHTAHADQLVRIHVLTLPLPTGIQIQPIRPTDMRGRQPATVLNRDATLALLGAETRVGRLATLFSTPLEVVLQPGTALIAQRETVNGAFTISLSGRVRKAAPSEVFDLGQLLGP
jgi:hypothetical protein